MIELRGLSWDHPRGHDCVVAAANAFSRTHPQTQVRWDIRSLEAFGDDHLDRLAERYDLLIIDHPHIPFAAQRGLLVSFDRTTPDDEADTAAVGPSHQSYAYGGLQYALAIDAAAQVSVSRPDLLPEVPVHWDEVFDLARQGRVLWPGKPIDAYSSLLSLAAAAGDPPFSTPGSFLSEATALGALEHLRRLAELVPAWCVTADPIAVAEALTSGDDHWFAPLLFGYSNYSRTGFRRVRLQYTDMTAGPHGVRGSLLGGAGIAVSARSTQRQAAVELAHWLASTPVQAGVYFDNGGQPAHRAAWESGRLDELTLDFFSGTRATLESAYVRPQHPRYIDVQERLAPLVTDVVAGRMSPEVFIATADDVTAEAMEET